jgi:hypothetical protein
VDKGAMRDRRVWALHGVCADSKGASVRVAPREGARRGSDGEAGVARARRATSLCGF